MSTGSNPRPKRRSNGLTIFAGVMVVISLIVVIGANVLFQRSLRQPVPVPAEAAPSAATSAAGPASAPAQRLTPEAANAPVAAGTFRPPPESSLPDGDYGKVIRLGEQVFVNTGKFAGRYVGNDLSCANCHLDAGRMADSAPLWASFIHYPAYRSKTGQVDTLASRGLPTANHCA